MISSKFSNLGLLEIIKYKIKKLFTEKYLPDYGVELFGEVCQSFDKNEGGIADFLEELVLSARLSAGDRD